MATILIVDAHSFNRVYLARILAMRGHRSIEAADAEAGIEIAEAELLDLVLVDFPLPTMDASHFLHRLRAIGAEPAPAVVVLTDPKRKRHTEALADEFGVAAVVAKPCDPELIFRVVESALDDAAVLQTASANSRNRYGEKWNGATSTHRDSHGTEHLGETLVDRQWPARDSVDFEGALKELFQRSPIAVGWADQDLRILRANEALIRLLGYSKARLFSMTWPELVHPDDRAECSEDRTTLQSGGEVAGRERRYLHRSGRIVTGSAHAVAIRDSTGHPYAFATQILDISNQKLTDVELSQTRDRLEAALDLSQVVVCELALEAPTPRVLWASKSVASMTGYSAVEALGPGWWTDRLHPDDANEVSRELVAMENSSREYRVSHRDGSFRWVLARSHRSATGTATVAWTDISDRKRLENSYRQSQKLESVGRLATGVAHDFNNLLTVIAGNAEQALQKLSSAHPADVMVRQIGVAAEQATKLVRQLMDFSQKGCANPEPLDLRTVVAAMKGMVARFLRQDIQFETEVDSDLGVVSADLGQMKQLLLNLILNAQDAMPSGGRLTISLHNAAVESLSGGRAVLLTVSDTGCGMDPATIAHAFEPFFTTKGRSGGLGLSTVHEIVQQGGGHVAVESMLGRGTTINVYWPRVDAQPVAIAPPTALTAPRHGSGSILLVEDDDGVRLLIGQVLRDCGYDVFEASDGLEAVRIANENPGRIELLISDLNLPKLGGRALAEKLKATHDALKILFVSGYAEDAVERGGTFGPDAHFLGKPFGPAVLAAKVRAVLG